jgi:hypothetical protein
MNRFQILDKTPVEVFKIFTLDYWTNNTNTLTPVVNSFSYHFWGYIIFICCIAIIAFIFRFYKGFFLNQKTLDNILNFNDPKNPIFAKLTFFENYFLVGSYLTAFFFLARQVGIAILSNKLFILAMFAYLIIGVLLAIKYFIGDKKIEEAFFYNNKTL